jgi:putative heme-binding domain-containing protein
MPYLGGKLVDDRGVVLVRDWIASMKPEKGLAPEVVEAQEAERQAIARLVEGDASHLPGLLEKPGGALAVALALLDGSLTGEVKQQAIEQGSAQPDPLRRDLFERFLPEEKRRRVLGQDVHPDKLLIMQGDAKRGLPLFTALCSSCHRVGETGAEFGPDLTRIGTKYPKPVLLEQIIAPSKVIEPAWQLTTLTLQNGDAAAGFVGARTEEALTLRVAGGPPRQIPLKDVTKTETARVSLMPEGLLQSLTGQEAADLLEYLASQR